jgi:hypothetical protein
MDRRIYMNKKTSIIVLVCVIVSAIIIGALFVNKGDGPVTGVIFAGKTIENVKAYNNTEKTQDNETYMVVSNEFNKFKENFKTSIPESKDLYAALHFVECVKGAKFTGKWLKDGKVIREDIGTLPTDQEGVISYTLDKDKAVKGSYVFELYDGNKKIFEKSFSIG